MPLFPCSLSSSPAVRHPLSHLVILSFSLLVHGSRFLSPFDLRRLPSLGIQLRAFLVLYISKLEWPPSLIVPPTGGGVMVEKIFIRHVPRQRVLRCT